MKHFIGLVCCFFLLSGCAATSLNPIQNTDQQFEADELRIWKRSAEEQFVLDHSGLIYSDTTLENYLTKIAQSLQTRDVLAKIPISVKVIKSPSLNAFAYPNGRIYVHSGMIAQMQNEAQLAILLAHEMTHSTHRHAAQSFRSIKNKTAFLSALQVGTFGFGWLGVFTGLLGGIGTMASVSGYSKDLETQADTVGFRLLVNAGYDPGEAPKLFELIKMEIEQEKIKEPFFFGTHPKIVSRIENFKALLKKHIRYKDSVIINQDIFFEKTKSLIALDAEMNIQAGRMGMARKELEKCIARRYFHPDVYFLLGEIYRQFYYPDSADQAIKYYQTCLNLDSSYSESYKSLGLLQYKLKNLKEAEIYFQQYLILCSDCRDKDYIEIYLKECIKRKN